MFKKHSIHLPALALALLLAWVSVPAGALSRFFESSLGAERRVFDQAALLDEGAAEALEAAVAAYRQESGTDLVLLTIGDAAGMDTLPYMEAFYGEKGFAPEGLILCMDMDNRVIEVFAAGSMARHITAERREGILKLMYACSMVGNYGEAFMEAIALLGEYMRQAQAEAEITVSAGAGGTVRGGGVYALGDTARIEAVPAGGYRFAGWSDGSMEAQRDIPVEGPASYAASFVQAAMPLHALAYFNAEDGFRLLGETWDNFGTKYSSSLRATSKNSWCDYRIDGAYATLTGRVILHQDYRSSVSDDTYVKIYGDGLLLYTSPLVSAGMEPADFSVDISGVKDLRVQILGDSGGYLIRIVDCYLLAAGESAPAASAEPLLQNARQMALADLYAYNYGDGFKANNSAADNFGTKYSNSLRATSKNSWCDYRIDGAYATLTGRVILHQDYRSSVSDDTYVKIYGDGLLLYTSPLVSAGMEPADFSVDISGVRDLRVQIQGDSGGYLIRIVDCYLLAAGENAPAASAEPLLQNARQMALADLYAYNYGDGFKANNSATDNFGTKYSSSLRATSKNSWCDYRIDGAYATLTGRVILHQDYRSSVSDDTYVKIYGDGLLLYTSPLVSAGMEPADFSVDISGVRDLRVQILGDSGGYLIRIVDCYLLGG